VDIKKCRGCIYWRLLGDGTERRCCHYILDTGISHTEDENGVCLVKSTKRKKANKKGEDYIT
jgi:hypothetical protein